MIRIALVVVLAQAPAFSEAPAPANALAKAPAEATGAAPQDPTAVNSASQRVLDEVELVGGERLEGAITVETDDYVEIRLDGGTVVGFGRDRVARLRRGVGAAEAKAVVAGAERTLQDQWFAVHDGAGQAVGWLHANARRQPDQVIRLEEEWEFTQDGHRTAVTLQEVVSAAGQALSCYYRERTFVAGEDRVRTERIVEARCDGDTLEVTRISGQRRLARSYRMPSGGSFPLTARWQMRHGILDAGATQDRIAVVLYDPCVEQFVVTSFRPARRRLVSAEGSSQEVTELLSETGPVQNAEWLDGTLAVVRREICGPSLVAVPADVDVAQSAGDRAASVHPASFALEPGARFGLWRPNPAWTFDDSVSDGRLALRCETHDAQITAVWLPDIEADPTMESAADTVSRWYSLVRPGFAVESRRGGQLRGRTCVVLVGSSREGASVRRSVVHVVGLRQGVLAITWSCPADRERLLRDDVTRVLETIDLDPQRPATGANATAVDAGVGGGAAAAGTPDRASVPGRSGTVLVPVGRDPGPGGR